jgi:hypothetical protein
VRATPARHMAGQTWFLLEAVEAGELDASGSQRMGLMRRIAASKVPSAPPPSNPITSVALLEASA